MTKKYWEMTRKQDIRDAKVVLASVKKYRYNAHIHTDGMRVARLFIDSIRNCNAKLKAYD